MLSWLKVAVRRRGRTGLAAGLGVLVALTGACTHYAAAPVQPAAFERAFDARRLPPSPVGGVWSGGDLLAFALDNNPAVAEAAAKYATAVRTIAVARQPPNMTLTLTAEFADQGPALGHAAALDLPIDRGGRRAGRIGQAELQALQAFYDWQEVAWSVRTALARARADLAGAEREITLAQDGVALRRERVERLRRRVEAGEDDRLSQLTVASDLLAAQRRASDAQLRRGQALLALAKALGLPAAGATGLRVAPPAEPAGLAELPLWRSQAAASRRDVLRALVDYDLAENALRVEVAKQYPEVRVQPGYFYDHGVWKVPVAVGLVLPPRDGNRSGIAQAEAARTAAGRSLETVQANVLGGVDGAAGGLQAAEAVRGRVQSADLPTARRMQAAAARRVTAGEGDRVEELGARAALADAELALADAERVRRTVIVDLEDALRRPFDPAEAAVLNARLPERSAK